MSFLNGGHGTEFDASTKPNKRKSEIILKKSKLKQYIPR